MNSGTQVLICFYRSLVSVSLWRGKRSLKLLLSSGAFGALITPISNLASDYQNPALEKDPAERHKKLSTDWAVLIKAFQGIVMMLAHSNKGPGVATPEGGPPATEPSTTAAPPKPTPAPEALTPETTPAAKPATTVAEPPVGPPAAKPAAAAPAPADGTPAAKPLVAVANVPPAPSAPVSGAPTQPPSTPRAQPVTPAIGSTVQPNQPYRCSTPGELYRREREASSLIGKQPQTDADTETGCSGDGH